DLHPAISLAYLVKVFWPNFDLHTFVHAQDQSRLYHQGIFVFLISIPGDDDKHLRYEISPQLCAIRGAGPPIVLSERILGHVIESSDDGVVTKLVPSADGVHVEFGPDADGSKPATSVHDVS